MSNACVACPAGATNAEGDDALGMDTACDAVICAENERVLSNACVSCAAGSTHASGDDATGADTECEVTLCGEDQHVVSNACVDCPAGATNAMGDPATGPDTSCDFSGLDYLSSTHSADDCTAAGGNVVTVAGDSDGTQVCRFNAGSCPSGWTSANGWSTTTPTAMPWSQGALSEEMVDCDGYAHTFPAIAAASGMLRSSSHAWSNLNVRETDSCGAVYAAGTFSSGCPYTADTIDEHTLRTAMTCDGITYPGYVQFYSNTPTRRLQGSIGRTDSYPAAQATRTQIGCY